MKRRELLGKSVGVAALVGTGGTGILAALTQATPAEASNLSFGDTSAGLYDPRWEDRMITVREFNSYEDCRYFIKYNVAKALIAIKNKIEDKELAKHQVWAAFSVWSSYSVTRQMEVRWSERDRWDTSHFTPEVITKENKLKFNVGSHFSLGGFSESGNDEIICTATRVIDEHTHGSHQELKVVEVAPVSSDPAWHWETQLSTVLWEYVKQSRGLTV